MVKPKLLVAVDSYLPRWDGIARVLSEVLPKMADQFEIRLMIPDYPGTRPDLPGVRYVTLPLLPVVEVASWRIPWINTQQIKREVDWADLLWTHTAVSIGAACIKYAHKSDKPILSMIHSTEWEVYGRSLPIAQSLGQWAWLQVARRRYGRALMLMTPSQATCDELARCGFHQTMAVTPLGVSLEQFKPLPRTKQAAHKSALGLPCDKPIIGYLGRFGQEKNLRTLTKAHRTIAKRHNAHLLLVGGTPKQLGTHHLSREDVTVVPQTNEPQQYYQAMDIYVLPSLTESFPLGILEAMATGVAPVSTPVGAVPSYLNDGKNGYLFQGGDTDKLASILDTLLTDTNHREKLGSQARRTVEEGFTWNLASLRIAQHILEQYSHARATTAHCRPSLPLPRASTA